MFITFEGIDNSGKTTQLKLLNEYFLKQNIETVLIREPGGTELSEKIRTILLSKDSNITDISELFLFASARNSVVNNVIKPALDAGKVVLCDRFIDSTTAYQGYGRGIDLNKIKLINELATNGLKPDLTFYLRITTKTAENRTGMKIKDRIEAAGQQFFDKVVKGYEEIAHSEPNRVKIIDSQEKIADTFNNILNIINKNSY